MTVGAWQEDVGWQDDEYIYAVGLREKSLDRRSTAERTKPFLSKRPFDASWRFVVHNNHPTGTCFTKPDENSKFCKTLTNKLCAL